MLFFCFQKRDLQYNSLQSLPTYNFEALKSLDVLRIYNNLLDEVPFPTVFYALSTCEGQGEYDRDTPPTNCFASCPENCCLEPFSKGCNTVITKQNVMMRPKSTTSAMTLTLFAPVPTPERTLNIGSQTTQNTTKMAIETQSITTKNKSNNATWQQTQTTPTVIDSSESAKIDEKENGFDDSIVIGVASSGAILFCCAIALIFFLGGNERTPSRMKMQLIFRHSHRHHRHHARQNKAL